MSRHRKYLVVVSVLLALVTACSMGTGAQTEPSAAQGATPIGVATDAPGTAGGATSGASPADLSVRDVAARVRPAVVQIATEQASPRQSGLGQATVLEGIGSGVILDAAGHILTNNH